VPSRDGKLTQAAPAATPGLRRMRRSLQERRLKVLAVTAENNLKKRFWALDRTEQCCGVSLPTLTKRFGTMAQQSPPASSNLNGDNPSPRPDSVDVAEAVALMDDLGETAEDEVEETASGDGDEGDDAENEGGEDGGETAEDAADEEAEASAEDAEPPEFWSADDKAAWESVPAELRPVLKKYEQQRVEFANEKAREAAQARAQAAQDVERANAVIVQAAQWWQQTGPALQQAFANKWATVDWKALAEKDPAEYARLDQERQKEQALLADANRRQQEDTKAATERAVQALELAKQAENAKLAHKLPDYFGSPEKAAKTYDELGNFLFAKGIPADRITQINEARSSKWRSTPCDSSRPRRELRPSRRRTRPREQHRLASLPDRPLAPATGRATRPGKWASGSGRMAETRSLMRPS
jgi:hypothetical protein